ncbi:unnamed protein product [Mycena citricolor]|uniref:Ubiquitin carboxyl-terminal hydrolase n=1 Tax=Mycena citricolor TaxID=2018698 RepID=A0AAD2HFD9_9AGAR|nr:unnamed protein product [Mycena citricolor]
MPASRWIPLESNPDASSILRNYLWLASIDQFEDVYGLDQELLDMVPQPVKALVLLFPITPQSEARRKEEDEQIAAKGAVSTDPTLIWIKQTIPNACGTMGMIHALANSDVTLVPESPLAKFIEQCSSKTPEERATLLETTPLFASIHEGVASTGQSAVPRNLDTDLHFTAFVRAPDVSGAGGSHQRIIELDGRRSGPIDRGECKDFLADAVKVIKDIYISASQSVEFNIMALCET